MEKMSFAFELSEEQKKKKETLVQQLMKNPHVLAWLKKHQKDEQFVYDHSGRFQDWCKRKEACENCKGLDFCRQEQKGVLLDLYLDGMLMNQLT
jgi:primosomal protein DnaI